jgi:hypothetical protein
MELSSPAMLARSLARGNEPLFPKNLTQAIKNLQRYGELNVRVYSTIQKERMTRDICKTASHIS